MVQFQVMPSPPLTPVDYLVQIIIQLWNFIPHNLFHALHIHNAKLKFSMNCPSLPHCPAIPQAYVK